MRLKLYRAKSMAEAMSQMRQDLGPDALILSARTLRDGVELTAALEPTPPPPPTPRVDPPRRPSSLQPPLAMPLSSLLHYHGIPDALGRRLDATALAASLALALRFAPLAPQDGPILFGGPPGAGKTTTVARLATRLVLAGERPFVITADGRRAGAPEQLAAYTRLLGLNLVVATHPGALTRTLAARETDGPVLIDAPGDDINDALQMEELAALATAAGARLALVLPAGLDPREAAEMAEAYANIGAALLIATKLDIARRLGGILAAANAGALALTEAGIGPGAADGLTPMTAAFLAGRLQRDAPPAPPPRAHQTAHGVLQ